MSNYETNITESENINIDKLNQQIMILQISLFTVISLITLLILCYILQQCFGKRNLKQMNLKENRIEYFVKGVEGGGIGGKLSTDDEKNESNVSLPTLSSTLLLELNKNAHLLKDKGFVNNFRKQIKNKSKMKIKSKMLKTTVVNKAINLAGKSKKSKKIIKRNKENSEDKIKKIKENKEDMIKKIKENKEDKIKKNKTNEDKIEKNKVIKEDKIKKTIVTEDEVADDSNDDYVIVEKRSDLVPSDSLRELERILRMKLKMLLKSVDKMDKPKSSALKGKSISLERSDSELVNIMKPNFLKDSKIRVLETKPKSKISVAPKSKVKNVQKSKRQVSPESKIRISPESKLRVTPESQMRVSLEPKKRVSPESKLRVTPESQMRVSLESKLKFKSGIRRKPTKFDQNPNQNQIKPNLKKKKPQQQKQKAIKKLLSKWKYSKMELPKYLYESSSSKLRRKLRNAKIKISPIIYSEEDSSVNYDNDRMEPQFFKKQQNLKNNFTVDSFNDTNQTSDSFL